MIVARAADAKAIIKKGLRSGGSFFVKTNADCRMISHDPILDRPESALWWPFSIFQTYNVSVSISPRPSDDKDDSLTHEDAVKMVRNRKTFSRNQIGDAISLFLKDVPLDSPISILCK